MKDIIDIGDLVNVYFEHIDSVFHAEVLGRPQDTGDCWKLKDKDDVIIYVQLYGKMVRVEEK